MPETSLDEAREAERVRLEQTGEVSAHAFNLGWQAAFEYTKNWATTDWKPIEVLEIADVPPPAREPDEQVMIGYGLNWTSMLYADLPSCETKMFIHQHPNVLAVLEKLPAKIVEVFGENFAVSLWLEDQPGNGQAVLCCAIGLTGKRFELYGGSARFSVWEKNFLFDELEKEADYKIVIFGKTLDNGPTHDPFGVFSGKPDPDDPGYI